MVGYTPSLSTAVWVGTTEGTKPLETASGASVYGSGLPSDIWKSTMDGALKGTESESFPKPTEIGGYAGVPQAPPPPPTIAAQPPPSETVDSADDRSGAGHYDPDRPADHCARRAAGTRRTRARAACSTAAWTSPAPVTERELVSPAQPAEDRRSFDARDLPSRTDAIGAALSGVIGGPVGRHALIGRQPILTPLRVMLVIALVFLALGYSTKAACLQTTGTGTADQRVGNWQNQRAYYELCYSDTVPLYTAELLNLGKFRTSPAGSRRTATVSRRPSTTATSPCGTWSIRC